MKIAAFTFVLMMIAAPALAHCDALDGPVVTDARLALQSGDATPVLKWIAARDEAEVRNALTQAIAVRKLSDAARDVADRWFFELVVRRHRQTEREPFDGLKPAGQLPEPFVIADRALEDGKLDALEALLTTELKHQLHERFAHARAARAHAKESVAAGREFVHAYAAFMHLVEQFAGGAHEEHVAP